MEDETGIMNAIVTPDLFDRNRLVLLSEPYLLIDGILQNVDNVISVKAGRIQALAASAAAKSHDFH
jgi:error-prone DNA polymerase